MLVHSCSNTKEKLNPAQFYFFYSNTFFGEDVQERTQRG